MTRTQKQSHNFFCDRERVREALEGKTVAIVGSGPGSLANLPGKVDSHDVVVRVNNYKLFTPTGKRTDIFYSFFGVSITKKKSELIRDGVKLCICKCPNDKFMDSAWHRKNGSENGVDFKFIYKNRKDWWFCDTYVPTVDEFLQGFNLLGGHVPTTGFSAILDVLSYNPKHIYLTGFDFFTTRLHNVNEPWKKNNKDDPICHVPEAEFRWIKANYKNLPISMDGRLRVMVGR